MSPQRHMMMDKLLLHFTPAPFGDPGTLPRGTAATAACKSASRQLDDGHLAAAPSPHSYIPPSSAPNHRVRGEISRASCSSWANLVPGGRKRNRLKHTTTQNETLQHRQNVAPPPPPPPRATPAGRLHKLKPDCPFPFVGTRPASPV